MKKPKKKSHRIDPHAGGENHGEDELWLISYADMMTLLFTFFVMLYAMSQSSSAHQESVREAMSKAFGGSYTPPQKSLLDKLQNKKQDSEILKHIDIQAAKDGLEITFRSSILFKLGKADLLPEAKESLGVLIEVIKENSAGSEIMVGGHTDNLPIRSNKYPSNWELSAARAATVVREFIKVGYDPKNLVVVGYGESRPAFSNEDINNNPLRENMKLNRRVVIKVVSKGIVKTSGSAEAASKGEAPKN